MTTYYNETVKCALCGAENEVTHFAVTSQFGSMDLDTRPPERMRSTMHTWVHSCGNCGYCSSDISKEIDGAEKAMSSEEYKQIREDWQLSWLAREFLCFATILEQSGKRDEAIFALLHAAWDCDDRGNEAKAKECRIRALVLIDEINVGLGGSTVNFVKLDLLRRTGKFEEAIDLAVSLNVSARELREIIQYQKELCLAKDRGVHTFGDAGKVR